MEDKIDVNQLRETQLIKINTDIDRAFKNRRQEKYQPKIKNTSEALAEAKQQRSTLEGLTDEAVVDAGDYIEMPYQASVENSHDYKDLITAALKKLASEGYYNEQDVQKGVEDTLEHEYEHHVPALGNEGLKVRYCVEFIEYKGRNSIGVRPFINLNGTMQIGVCKEVFGASKKPSATDKIMK
jgi:hypothetical protein